MSDLQNVVDRFRWSVAGRPQPRPPQPIIKCSVCGTEHTPGRCPACGFLPKSEEQKSELKKAGLPVGPTPLQRFVKSLRGGGQQTVEKTRWGGTEVRR